MALHGHAEKGVDDMHSFQQVDFPKQGIVNQTMCSTSMTNKEGGPGSTPWQVEHTPKNSFLTPSLNNVVVNNILIGCSPMHMQSQIPMTHNAPMLVVRGLGIWGGKRVFDLAACSFDVVTIVG